ATRTYKTPREDGVCPCTSTDVLFTPAPHASCSRSSRAVPPPPAPTSGTATTSRREPSTFEVGELPCLHNGCCDIVWHPQTTARDLLGGAVQVSRTSEDR